MKLSVEQLRTLIAETLAESDDPVLDAELKKKGLRLARYGEAGWYVRVAVDGEAVKVWATDLPENEDF